MSTMAFQETALASQMSIDEQVTWLMQGTEFGDETLAKTMTRELRARIEESRRTGKPLKVDCGYDPRTGDKRLDCALLDGQFGGSTWAVATSWCTAGGSRLFVGDVNNDGRDDWVCHHVESGLKWVDLASEAGQFLGTDWQSNAPWCSLEAQLLH